MSMHVQSIHFKIHIYTQRSTTSKQRMNRGPNNIMLIVVDLGTHVHLHNHCYIGAHYVFGLVLLYFSLIIAVIMHVVTENRSSRLQFDDIHL